MLVLSRKSGQKIQIGDNITITVTKVGGNQVRLGIDAPMETPIRRGELRLQPDPPPKPRPGVSGSLGGCLHAGPANPVQPV